MSQASPSPTPSPQPHLSPQFCFNTTALRDFLRISRSTVDDSISAHLNSLLTPSRTSPFNPLSTASKTSQRPTSYSRQNIPSTACTQFKHQILFPSWKVREDVLAYCSQVAETPDRLPPPPGALSSPGGTTREPPSPSIVTDAAGESPTGGASPAAALGVGSSMNYWNRPQVVDERTDPYSARDYSYTREGRTEVLKNAVRNEEGVEKVVRTRTWAVLSERCFDDGRGSAAAGSWEEEWNAWKENSVR